MIRSIRQRMVRADDAGAALVLALIMITVIAVVGTALLSLADTSTRTTVAMRDQAAAAYNADGAAQAAINALRKGTFNNDTSSPTFPKCFGSAATSDTLVLPNFYPGTTGSPPASAAVTCSADPNSGAAGGLVPVTGLNKPGNAILTLGTNSSEDGLYVKALNNTVPFSVHGSVISNSNIRAINGPLQSNTSITARTGCTGTIISIPAVVCNAATATTEPNYQFEPSYGSPANAIPGYQPVPSNVAASCPGKVVTFNPGYYDDAKALSDLMDGNGSCKGSVWWFKPGTYYFDFHNTENSLLSGSDVWTIKDGQLVAGTPVNSAGNPIAIPVAPVAIPKACQSPITSTTAAGVQFIFGGDSQLVMSGGADAEICGTYRTNRPPIAIYGLTTGAEITTTLTGANVLNTTTVVAAGSFANATTINQTKIETNYAAGTFASWVTTNNGNGQVGQVNVRGYAPGTAIPAGSNLLSAALRVGHRYTPLASSGKQTESLSVTVTPNSGSAFAITVPSYAGTLPAGQTDSIDIKSQLASLIHTNGFSGAAMTYQATVDQKGTEDLDGIELNFTYIAPAFRAETSLINGAANCLAATYTGGSSGQCAALTMSASYSGKFYVQGTTYMPKAVIDMTLNNIAQQVLRFGVIARSLWVKETGSISYTGPVIEVPDDSPGLGAAGTIVYLTAYVCRASPTCSASGRLGLRVKVLIKDPSGTPVAGKREMTIQSWSVQR